MNMLHDLKLFRPLAGIALSLLAISSASALTAPALQLTSGTNTVTIDSTGTVTLSAGCSCSTLSSSIPFAGGIAWSGTIGNFTVTGLLARSKPALPSPVMDVGLVGLSAGGSGGTLTITFSDTGFSGAGPSFTMSETSVGVSGSLTATFDAFVDGTNTLFGTATKVGELVESASGNQTATGLGPLAQPFSMTNSTTYTLAAGASLTSDFALIGSAQNGNPPPPPPTPIVGGDTATIGFWQNKNGQAVIDSFNGSSTSTALATWLATTFPYLYGVHSVNNETGQTNAQIAAFFITVFGSGAPKTDAQVLAGALACYATSTALGNDATATKFGFNSSSAGTCNHTINVGSDGTAIGLINNTSYTVLQLLNQVNFLKTSGPLTAAEINAINDIFTNINQTGDIK
jgi:hypothetical protein